MALSIHTNYSSLVTNTALNKSNNALATNQQRLGTGFRINSAADDAAGLQIATRLNAQSRGMAVAMRNTGDAISMLQTAEGAFNELTDITQRMKDLATQAANDTNSDKDRTSIGAELTALQLEFTNIVTNTTYAGEKILGTAGFGAGAVSFQIGATEAETYAFNASTHVAAVKLDAAPDVSDAAKAGASITALNNLLDTIGTARAAFGAGINRLNHTNNNLANMRDNTEMAKGRIMDADFALESANMSKNSMLMQSGISMLKQAGQMPGMVMGLLG